LWDKVFIKKHTRAHWNDWLLLDQICVFMKFTRLFTDLIKSYMRVGCDCKCVVDWLVNTIVE
jgi:hypothetical protein